MYSVHKNWTVSTLFKLSLVGSIPGPKEAAIPRQDRDSLRPCAWSLSRLDLTLAHNVHTTTGYLHPTGCSCVAALEFHRHWWIQRR